MSREEFIEKQFMFLSLTFLGYLMNVLGFEPKSINSGYIPYFSGKIMSTFFGHFAKFLVESKIIEIV